MSVVPASKLRILIPLLLGLVTLLVFLPATKNDFVNYDDPDYVTNNPWVQQGVTSESIKWAFTAAHSSNWHPLTWISHMLDWQLFGPKAAGHHFTNVAIHAINTLLLFFLLQKMTGAFWRSIFAAALFGLHPMHVESVAWVSERKDLLSTHFGLVSIWFYVSYVRAQRVSPGAQRHSRSAILAYSVAVFFFALSLMSKPMWVTLPFLLLLLDFWPLGKVSNFKQAPKLLLEKLPFLALTIISIFITIWAQKSGGSIQSMEQLPFGLRFQNAIVSYGVYLKKLFWPVDLAVFYPYLGPAPLLILIVAILVLMAISVAAVLFLRPQPFILSGWCWFLGTLVPVIGIVQVGDQAFADRYTYIPFIGLFVVISWLLGDWIRKKPQLRAPVGIIAVLLLAVFAVLTTRQIWFWRNTATLFEHTFNVTKQNFLAAAILATERWKSGEREEAQKLLRQSLEWKPHFADAHFALGDILVASGETADALRAYLTALKLRPNNAEGHLGYGVALLQGERFSDAEKAFEKSVELRPNSPKAYVNLGISLHRQQKFGQAIRAFDHALEVEPQFAPAYINMAQSFAALDKFAEAESAFQKALNLDPKNARLHFEFALFLEGTGRPSDAVTHYRETVRLQPNSADALNNLAWLLATADDSEIRNGVAAVSAGEKAVELTDGKIPMVMGTLAAAYAEAGRFQDAIQTAEKARTLAEQLAQQEVAERNAALIQLYRNAKTAREFVK